MSSYEFVTSATFLSDKSGNRDTLDRIQQNASLSLDNALLAIEQNLRQIQGTGGYAHFIFSGCTGNIGTNDLKECQAIKSQYPALINQAESLKLQIKQNNIERVEQLTNFQKPQNIIPDNIIDKLPTQKDIISSVTGINPLLILGGIGLIALTVLKK